MKRIIVLTIFLLASILFFWKFTVKGMIPAPGDLIVGAYYPWLNSKWGYEVGVPVKNPLTSDVISQFYPWRMSVVKSIRKGELPLWNRSYFLGMTLVGNVQAGVFNPFNILLLLNSNFGIGWGWMVVIQPILAMLGMYALLRSWRISVWGAVIGSLAYGLNGQMLMWVEYNVHGFIFAILPMILYFLQKRGRDMMWASVLIAFGFLAGYPQMMYYVLGFVAIFGIWQVWSGHKKREERLKELVKLGVVLGFGLGLAAIQLWPGMATLNKSIRDVDMVAESVGVKRLPMANLITAFIPDFFGNPATYNYWGKGIYESFSFYTSLVVVVLSLLTLKLTRKNGIVRYGWLVVGLSLFLALGSPLTDWIQKISFLGLKGSTAVRGLFGYGFGMSILGAFGFDEIFRSKTTEKKVFIIPALLLGTAGVVYLASRSNESLTISLRNTIWPGIISSATVLWLMSTKKFKWLVGLGLVVLIFGDMFRFGDKYLPFTKAELMFPNTPTSNWLQNQPGPFRVGFERAELFPAISWSPYGLESPSGYDVLVPKLTTDFISRLNHGKDGLERARFIEVKNFESDLVNMADIKYVVTLDKREAGSVKLPDDQFELVFREGKVLIWENKFNRGRYYEPQNKCDVEIVKYGDNGSELKTRCDTEGELIMAEPFDEGWKVRVNGVSVRPQSANWRFMQIPVPVGESKVVLEYFPNEVLWGAVISLVSMGLFLVVSKYYEV